MGEGAALGGACRGYRPHSRGHRAGPAAGLAPMRVRTRELIGVVGLLLFLGCYALVVASIASGRITTAPPLAQFAFFLVGGLVWVLPAALLIRARQRREG